MNLILFTTELSSGLRLSLSGEKALYLAKIQKVGVGYILRVGSVGKNGSNGSEGKARVLSVSREEVSLEVIEVSPSRSLSGVQLVLGLPRPQMLKRIFETIGTFGLESLILLPAERSQKSYLDSSILLPETIDRHILVGMEQGCITRKPKVELLRSGLKDLEALSEAYQHKFLAQPETSTTFLTYFGAEGLTETCSVAIGCEGGWTDFEQEQLKELGYSAVGLGHSVLRVQTAVCAVLAQLELCSQVLP